MTSRNAVTAAWVLLGVLVVGVLVWALWPSGARSDAQRSRELASEIRCPDCESLSAADSQTASARAIRRDIRTRVGEGESDAVIRQAYVDRYGQSILLKPSSSGLGLLVWGLPVALVLIGGGALVLTFRRWRQTEPLRATDADEAIVRRARAKDPDVDSAS